MFTKNDSTQQKLEMVYIENLVPQDHLLRKIDKHINFSFIYDLVKDLYCHDNGRPALDPVVLFKMIFIGYLFGIRSERQLEREIQVNVAYRWFLGLSLTDKVPDYSTISQNRRRRFKNTDVAQKIFDEIVRQAIKYSLVDGKILYSDSTHLKANANKKKSIEIEMQKSTKDYLDELDKAIDDERKKHGKKSLKKRENKPELKKIKINTTDPESGYMMRDGKPEGFFYLDHRTVDGKHNIIIDTHTTPGNVNDVDPYLERLDATIDKFNFNTKCVGLDAGYYVNHICKGIIDRKLKGALGYRLGPHEKGKFTKNKFQYVIEQDVYYCPFHYALEYRTTTRDGYSEYVSKPENCMYCIYKEQCLLSKNEKRVIRRHVWEGYKEEISKFTRSDDGKRIYKRRKETIERSFADSKELHGLRYCRMRGLAKVQEQCLLTAACQNMKKIAMMLSKHYFALYTMMIDYLKSNNKYIYSDIF